MGIWVIGLLVLLKEEHLLYTAKYGFLTAGEIKLHYVKEDSIVKIRCEQETKGFFSGIFRVKDWYESLCDTNFTMKRFEKHIEEGKYRAHQIIEVQEGGKAIYNGKDTVEIIPYAKDIISLIYWLRTCKFIPGSTIVVPFHSDKKNYKINTSIQKVKLGKEECFLLIPDLKGIRIFGGKGGLLLYYNQKKVPILLKIKFLWGYLEARLKERRYKE